MREPTRHTPTPQRAIRRNAGIPLRQDRTWKANWGIPQERSGRHCGGIACSVPLHTVPLCTCLRCPTKHTALNGAEPCSSPLGSFRCPWNENAAGGLLLLRHAAPPWRRDVVYFHSGAHNRSEHLRRRRHDQPTHQRRAVCFETPDSYVAVGSPLAIVRTGDRLGQEGLARGDRSRQATEDKRRSVSCVTR